MGIIDVDTMNLAFKELQSIKKDVIFYGEGWDMCTNLPGDKKASMYNANSIKPIGFSMIALEILSKVVLRNQN